MFSIWFHSANQHDNRGLTQGWQFPLTAKEQLNSLNIYIYIYIFFFTIDLVLIQIIFYHMILRSNMRQHYYSLNYLKIKLLKPVESGPVHVWVVICAISCKWCAAQVFVTDWVLNKKNPKQCSHSSSPPPHRIGLVTFTPCYHEVVKTPHTWCRSPCFSSLGITAILERNSLQLIY